MLGAIIGNGAVITVVTIGRGAQSQTESQLKSLGSNLLFVQSGVATTNSPSPRELARPPPCSGRTPRRSPAPPPPLPMSSRCST
ncbi:MAG: ABC transporter permease [Cyanobium sp. ELA712]